MNLFPILKKVARSFYLTIRLLPPVLQEPVALAYLLARTTDTLADEDLAALNESHRHLIQLLPSLLEELKDPQRDPVEASAIKTLWQHIVEGQQWEIEKFSAQEVLTLPELDHYLYLVAGCVGEFWTTLAHHHLPNFSKESVSTMAAWGINYGKGLQLTNMLRDREEDKQRGRSYYADEQFSELYAQAFACLQEGKCYVQALKPGRFKLASALPLLLAEKTLALLCYDDSMRSTAHQKKAKVSRYTVYKTLLRAIPMLFLKCSSAKITS